MATSDAVERFRADYRANEIPARYSGRLHLAITFGGGGALLLASLLQLEDVSALEAITVPLAFLYANLAEYWGHRTAMHRPVPGLRLVYRRHAGQHHRFFTDRDMPIDDWRDLRAVLFPPLLAAFFFFAFALPAGWLIARFAGSDAAWLFVATGIGYFLNYEFLHLAYHAPPGSWLARLPGIAALARLHRAHHNPAHMARSNFNITYPIGDVVFGTLRHEGASRDAETAR